MGQMVKEEKKKQKMVSSIFSSQKTNIPTN